MSNKNVQVLGPLGNDNKIFTTGLAIPAFSETFSHLACLDES